jgi:hypothetical protein
MAGNAQMKDMTGRRFGFLTVLRRDGQYRNTTRAAWLCRCDCGKVWTVDGDALRRGLTKSCGCKRGGKVTHGMSKTRLYHVWSAMKARCTNPKDAAWTRYGGRGIRVDPAWMRFETFAAGMGPEPKPGMTLERIDNDGAYSKQNCRWATRKEQANNTRRNVVIQTCRGPVSIAEAARMVGVTYYAMRKRMEAGLKGDDLLLPKYSRLPKSTTS